MKNRLICIGIVGLLLLMSVPLISAVEMNKTKINSQTLEQKESSEEGYKEYSWPFIYVQLFFNDLTIQDYKTLIKRPFSGWGKYYNVHFKGLAGTGAFGIVIPILGLIPFREVSFQIVELEYQFFSGLIKLGPGGEAYLHDGFAYGVKVKVWD